jgi:hypothetical protein
MAIGSLRPEISAGFTGAPVVALYSPIVPVPSRFRCVAIFASSAYKCQGFCHLMPEERVEFELIRLRCLRPVLFLSTASGGFGDRSAMSLRAK